jgi:hypothetical protein
MSRTLGVAREAIGDMSDVWRDVVHPYLLEHLAKNFDTLGRYGGDPWKSLKGEPKYYAYKKALLGQELADKVLWWDEEGERLRPSLIDSGDKDHRFTATPTSMFFGSAVDHASSLIEGGTGPFGESFPGRNIFAMTQSQRKGLITLIQRAIIDKVNARGTRGSFRDML